MFKKIILGLFLVGSLFANDFLSKKVELPYNVITMKAMFDKIYVTTDFGEVLEIQYNNDLSEITQSVLVKLPNISSFFDDSYPPKVFSIDSLDGKTFLINSEAQEGGKNLFLYDGALKKIFGSEDNLNIKKAAFVDDNTIFLGLVSNEVILYDLKAKKNLYRIQLSEATFSDFWLSGDKKYFLVSCESGIMYFGDVKSGKVLVNLQGENKDNVYQANMYKNAKGDFVILTAGQDRHAGIYILNKDLSAKSYSMKSSFLVYAVGLSKDGSRGAFMSDEKSQITIFDVKSKKILAKLNGHENLLNTIIFVDNDKIISAEDGKNILFWNLIKEQK